LKEATVDTERLAILDEQMVYIGVRTREEVHTLGFWHETFHCWFLKEEGGKKYLLFQLRSAQKKDYPSLLDVTAAGHLLAGETPMDGLREVEEEVGVSISFEHLVKVGVLKEEQIEDGLINREMCHVYLYRCDLALDDFVLQEEEVSGLVLVELEQYERFERGECETVKGYGYKSGENGERIPLGGWEKGVTSGASQSSVMYTTLPGVDLQKSDFCPHSERYSIDLLAAVRSLV
jgi:isopentenyldiphosphate isomerase